MSFPELREHLLSPLFYQLHELVERLSDLSLPRLPLGLQGRGHRTHVGNGRIQLGDLEVKLKITLRIRTLAQVAISQGCLTACDSHSACENMSD